MKLPRNALIWCVLIVCLTLLIFTCLTRDRLCEFRLKGVRLENGKYPTLSLFFVQITSWVYGDS
ncbi:Hok/Gef family protein [Citrobacter freundii]|uniref:Hok/Gef family protein n=1 Tax=Citrobacter freundii TaxID=546 RepID=UPI00397CEDD5